MNLSKLTTESLNEKSLAIDSLDTLQLVELINSEDRLVAEAVGLAANEIAHAVEIIVDRLRTGGRLIYIGAGTSGRLGVLDASECPPTFNTPPEMIVGLIAGGDRALRTAIEGAEDSRTGAADDLKAIGLRATDCVMGIATSGRTPYVVSGLQFARSLGCATLGHTCNSENAMADVCDVLITTVVGPEVISGSTRMKSGTATKLVLNTLTTASMVRLGKTFGNLMVDLRATNQKLVARSLRLVRMLTGLDEAVGTELLQSASGEVKTAIAMYHLDCDASTARSALANANGQLRTVIGSVAICRI